MDLEQQTYIQFFCIWRRPNKNVLENRRLITVTVSKTVNLNVLKQSNIVFVNLLAVNVS